MKVYVYYSNIQNKKNMHFAAAVSNSYKKVLIIVCH